MQLSPSSICSTHVKSVKTKYETSDCKICVFCRVIKVEQNKMKLGKKVHVLKTAN